MDGIAIESSKFFNEQRNFLVENIQPAGSSQVTLQNSENCIEVMTGAVLPIGVDAVIRYELITITKGVATINLDTIVQWQNVHKQGKDKKQGDLLIAKNTQISAAEIGVLATVGKAIVKVAKQPKIMIVSTGDELVSVSEKPLTHQIRRSNVHTLVSLLENLKISSDTAHITDDKPILKAKIKQFLEDYDVLLFSGAVSKGKYDFLPEVLLELGVEKQFHRVAQRPGKPFWFGKKDTTTIFAFPGNPVSTFVNCIIYFYPWVQKSFGLQVVKKLAILAEDYTFKPALTLFLQVALINNGGKLLATPIKGNGSGDLASLVLANAFIELPANRNEFKKGEVFTVVMYRY